MLSFTFFRDYFVLEDDEVCRLFSLAKVDFSCRLEQCSALCDLQSVKEAHCDTLYECCFYILYFALPGGVTGSARSPSFKDERHTWCVVCSSTANQQRNEACAHHTYDFEYLRHDAASLERILSCFFVLHRLLRMVLDLSFWAIVTTVIMNGGEKPTF